MSKKSLDHKAWVLEQFREKFLIKNYRNTFIHASIIESMLVNKCKIDNFNSAIKCLRHSIDITPEESDMFNKIRINRNKIAHRIFKGRGLSQKEIDEILIELRNTILEAYKTSVFLNEYLFKEYNIPRIKIIAFKK